jgi:hypothetical protein
MEFGNFFLPARGAQLSTVKFRAQEDFNGYKQRAHKAGADLNRTTGK